MQENTMKNSCEFGRDVDDEWYEIGGELYPKGEIIGGKVRSPQWVDEHCMDLPPLLEDILIKTVRDYYNKYHNSEYMSRSQYINMMHWMDVMNIVEEIHDELL